VYAALNLVGQNPEPAVSAVYLAGIASFVGIGALLVSRIPANVIGALLLAAGTTAAAAGLIGFYADVGAVRTPPWPGAELARHVADAVFVYPIFIALVFVPLVFPDGHLPSRWFRLVVVMTLVEMAGWTLGALGVVRTDVVVAVATPVAFGGAATAVIVRFRRGDLVQREQIKWLGAVVILAAIVIPLGLYVLNDLPDLGNVLISVGILLLFALPIAIGVAILRYRLYAIDRIVSRTIAYAVVVGVIGAVFGGGVVLLSSAMASIANGQTIAVAGATLVAYAIFQPVLRRVRRAVDRRFDRARYDAERTAAAFGERLRDETDLATVTADLAGTARSALAPASLRVWLRGTGR
jgi:hypothetical protein